MFKNCPAEGSLYRYRLLGGQFWRILQTCKSIFTTMQSQNLLSQRRLDRSHILYLSF
ncbi:hypothetical protein Scep_030002 [Stephania cephalantha]|uniref:Uncharacterized protein n=1 Tax=Stephania cephalantha TaxID=152367 RepID=A0AAP0DYV2_9MAGN